jgi:hypothetical protein
LDLGPWRSCFGSSAGRLPFARALRLRWCAALFLIGGSSDSYVATTFDASSEELSLVLPRTIGATGGRIADLTRWELLRSKNFARPCQFCGDGLGLAGSRRQRGSSCHQKCKGCATNSPMLTHCETSHLFATINFAHACDPTERAVQQDPPTETRTRAFNSTRKRRRARPL